MATSLYKVKKVSSYTLTPESYYIVIIFTLCLFVVVVLLVILFIFLFLLFIISGILCIVPLHKSKNRNIWLL